MDATRVVRSALSATRSLARTGYLSLRKSSDVRRWRDDGQINPQWLNRSIVATELIRPGTSVIEFGAGTGRLGELLPPGCVYQPTDLVRRTPAFLEIDLNTDAPLPTGYDVAVLLGVIEYLHDPESALRRLRDVAGRLVLSYCPPSPGVNRLTRRSRGWVNDMSYEYLTTALSDAGFQLESQRELEPANRPRQVLIICDALAHSRRP